MQHTQRRPGTLGMPPRHQSRPPKPKAWSHQDELLAMRGRAVTLTYCDGQHIHGELLEADAFALKLRREGHQSTVIVWKHDLSGISLKVDPA